MYRLQMAVRSLSLGEALALGVIAVLVLVLGGFLLVAIVRRLRSQEKGLAPLRQLEAERSSGLDSMDQELRKLMKPGTAESVSALQVAHELRSPVSSMYQALDVVLQGYTAGSQEVQIEILSLVRDRAGAMLAMLNDLLYLGTLRQAEVGKKVLPVQLLDVLWRVVPEFRIKSTLRGVELELDVPDSLPLIGCTEEHVAQLLSNLIDNAIKYTNPGGKVSVSFRAERGLVVGTVRDTGIGMAAEDLSRVFDGFFRADNAKEIEPYGTGLGLSLVKRLIDLYDGQLDLESELGKGTTFTFSLPEFRGAADEGSKVTSGAVA
ncbi:MAG: HAMP domain-containing histidine kinase [Anaerolineales bacterium]|nr:MAG: HAMP domain-containing histidine kinase [Anaerolineales bacterium]